MDEITEDLRTMIATKLKVDADRIRPETDLVRDLGADSLDVVELIMALEERHGVTIDDAEAEAVRTFSDAVELVRAKRAA